MKTTAASTPNQHLSIIFSEVLPTLTKADIKYWTHGGVAIAGVVGKFLRENGDVDIYILASDFPKAERLLRELCEYHGSWDADHWELGYSMLKKTGRPKLNLYIQKTERLSVVPVYPHPDGVDFRFVEPLILSDRVLMRERRTVDGFEFYSPPDDIVKYLHTYFMKWKIEYRNPQKIIDPNSKSMIDARAILTDEEVKQLVELGNKTSNLNHG